MTRQQLPAAAVINTSDMSRGRECSNPDTLAEADTDIDRQMTATDDNLLRAVVRNERRVHVGLLRYSLPLQNGVLSTCATEPQ